MATGLALTGSISLAGEADPLGIAGSGVLPLLRRSALASLKRLKNLHHQTENNWIVRFGFILNPKDPSSFLIAVFLGFFFFDLFLWIVKNLWQSEPIVLSIESLNNLRNESEKNLQKMNPENV